ncbi:MAG: DUF1800 domain-containing protein [Rhodocyclaceae bacterium]|nr:DUF1800 domain-containing protein [Rhodocyclaceae bacterium]MBP6110389.1 DUF1800 domain-containing protein [Rhodocyclaceae bacterium]
MHALTIETTDDSTSNPLDEQRPITLGLAAGLAPLALTACGGGGSGSTATVATTSPPPVVSTGPTRVQAARFLAQASLSSTAAEITQVQTLGYSAWLDQQMALPRSSTNVAWLRSKGLDNVAYKNSQVGADQMLWRKLLASPDPLRQRVTLALSEIIVVSVAGIANTPFRQFAAAAFMDILEANAFGDYRTLLEQVSTSVAMGGYLTYKGNVKANASTGSLPDENYAREVMQLFSVGLAQLNQDGSVKLSSNGQPLETYVQDDVSQLARVFTGWNVDIAVGTNDDPNRIVIPMVQYASRHELGTKSFLGTVIPANTDGVNSLRIALDTLMAHPNMGPFIGRQLIQRLVTSQPSAAYVSRVAATFNNNGSGVKGDLRAVLRAVLLDTEARADASVTDPTFGKLREPMIRFIQWARTFSVTDPTDEWKIGDLTDPATKLGQSPLRSPSVFNFFRPGYVPPNSPIGARTAPEFQITTESSVAGYVNFMQGAISNGVSGLRADYTSIRTVVSDSAALLAELNVVLAAGQLSAATLASLKSALDSISVATTAGSNNRLYAAITLVMASPEYIALK